MFDALIFSYMPLMNHNKDYTTDSLLMFYLIVKLFLYCFSLSWFGTFKFLGHLQRKLCVPGTHQEGSVVQYGIYLCLWTMEWIWHPPPSEASIGWKKWYTRCGGGGSVQDGKTWGFSCDGLMKCMEFSVTWCLCYDSLFYGSLYLILFLFIDYNDLWGIVHGRSDSLEFRSFCVQEV
jgi:hypothetical protein